MGKKHISTQVVLIFTSPVSFTLITGPLPIPSGRIGFRTPVILDTVGRAAWSLSWCKKTQEYGKNLRGRTSRSDWRDGASAAGLVTANLPFSIFDFFFSTSETKAFLFQLPLILPSFLLACGAAHGPPDAYRQMSLVEQNTLCLTSQAAPGSWRKLKGSVPC